jgi:hypothetical protein
MRKPLTAALLVFVVACGHAENVPDSGTPGAGGGAAGGGATGAAGGGPSQQDRITAATQTATTNPACNASLLPEGFYWEIGDRNGLLASGTVSGTDTPTASRVIAIASSSKWIFSTYVLQKLGSLRASDLPFLHFTSGNVFPATKALKEVLCGATETVGECAADVVQDPAAAGNFFYSAGHFQYHAANVMGLGSLKASALTTEITSTVGTFDFVYLQTNLAGGLNTSASGYAAFLRRMLREEYVMSSQLGTNKVCASSACATGAVLSPAPPDEAWNYSLGHWVEDDPTVGDHAFSSAGALGFYPWLDRTKTWYGVLARRAATPAGNEGVASLRCGRLIRQAWVTGLKVTQTMPTPH